MHQGATRLFPRGRPGRGTARRLGAYLSVAVLGCAAMAVPSAQPAAATPALAAANGAELRQPNLNWPSAGNTVTGPLDTNPLTRAPGLPEAVNAPATLPLRTAHAARFALRPLPWGGRFVTGTRVVTRFKFMTRSGVCMDTRTTPPRPHPVIAAHCGQVMWDNYRRTNNRAWLTRAIRQGNWLISRRQQYAGAWFYPYLWNHTLEASATVGPILLRRPWYSAMAQGEALSLFVRLSESTDDPKWRAAADATFASLLVSPQVGRPWASWIHQRYLWLELTTFADTPTGARILNGHMFALFGVYDYWRLTGNPTAGRVARAALTTSLVYARKLRRPYWRSYYDDYRRGESNAYHYTHVHQLQYLAEMTGDMRFTLAAVRLWQDAQEEVRTGTIRFRGLVRAYRFGPGRRPILARTLRVAARGSAAPLGYRYRVFGTRHMWLRPSAGSLAGLFIPERRGTAYVHGAVGVLDFRLPLALSARTSTVRFYRYHHAARSLTTATTARPRAGIRTDRFAILNGAPHFRVASGAFRTTWVAAHQLNI